MHTILKRWQSATASYLSGPCASLTRRHFLKTSAVIACVPVFWQLTACGRKQAQQDLMQQEPWPTFAAVHDILFPADGNGPSASDIQATLYLSLVIDTKDFDPADRRFILDGISWLEQLAADKYKVRFIAADQSQRAKVIEEIAQSKVGDRWLNLLLTYVLEALLADPVYGGNPDGIGWQWLQHSAGFPRPLIPYYENTFGSEK